MHKEVSNALVHIIRKVVFPIPRYLMHPGSFRFGSSQAAPNFC